MVPRVLNIIEIAYETCSIIPAKICLHHPGADETQRNFLHFDLSAIIGSRYQPECLKEMLSFIHMRAFPPFLKHFCCLIKQILIKSLWQHESFKLLYELLSFQIIALLAVDMWLT